MITLFVPVAALGQVVPGTIHVPGDYPTIQAAINAANPGDTVLVNSGTYIEEVAVNKTIRLIGVNTGSGLPVVYGLGSIGINISVSNVTVQGFNVTHVSTAFIVYGANHTNVTGNVACGNHNGIMAYMYYGNISGNNFSNNDGAGIYLRGSNYMVSGNTLDGNSEGLYLEAAKFNNVTGNTARNNDYYGICVYSGSGITSENNTIWLNRIEENGYSDAIDTNVNYLNRSVNRWNSTGPLQYTYKGTVYTNYTGNYWSNYRGQDANGDGIGDTSNFISTNSSDCYPMMNLLSMFQANATLGSTPMTVQFNDMSCGFPTSWSWNFGDGSTSTLQNPLHTYVTPGTYTVRLNVTNSAGSSSKTKAGYILVLSSTPVQNARTGLNYASLQAAIDDANTLSGDTIYVTSGVLRENVIVHKTLKFVGFNTGHGQPVVDGLGGTAISIIADGVALQGFTVNNSTRDVYVASDFNNLTGNTLSSVTMNGQGIYLDGSSNNIIDGNSVKNCRDGNIWAYGSNNTVSDNMVTGGRNYGIYVRGTGTTVTGNTAGFDDWDFVASYHGIILTGSNNYATGNTVAGSPFGICVEGSGHIVTGNTISNAQYGIRLNGSCDNNVSYNTLTKNQNSIYLDGAGHNILKGNLVNKSSTGIYVKGDGNSLTGNDANNNTYSGALYYGIYLEGNGNAVTGNSVRDNGCGIHLSGANNDVSGNTATGNDDGIHLNDSYNNSVRSNVASNNAGFGIYLNGSNNDVRGNTAGYETYGIYVENSSSDNGVRENIANYNNQSGIYVGGGSGCNVSGNTAGNNAQFGIHLVGLSGSNVSGNTVNNNGMYGIRLNGPGNDVTGNTASGNAYYGIYLSGSDHGNVTGNIAGTNKYGLYLSGLSNNSISGNNLNHNNNGISLYGSSDNALWLNRIDQNTINVYVNGGGSNTWHSPGTLNYVYNGSIYANHVGNYWSDYAGPDADGNGLGDTPYQADVNNIDYYPSYLMAGTHVNPVIVDDDWQGMILGPGMFASITPAIAYAVPGDKVFVRSGTYEENVVVNKAIGLTGVDTGRGLPTVDGNRGNAITINANGVSLQGFNVVGGNYGIWVRTSNNFVGGNTVSKDGYGIYLTEGTRNNVTGNTVDSCDMGILVKTSNNNNISANYVLGNGYGIYLDGSSNNVLWLNSLEKNEREAGIRLGGTNYWNSSGPLQYAYNGHSYTNYTGNYWSEIRPRDGNGDGIGDSRYAINEVNIDQYPMLRTRTLLANFAPNVSSGAVPLNVLFTDTSTGYPESWNWSFGDGTANATVKNPTHLYTGTGKYAVTLTVTRGTDSSTISKYVDVQPASLNATFVGHNMPDAVIVGRTYNVSVTFRNAGNTIWSEADLYRMLAFGDTAALGITGNCDNHGCGYPEYAIPAGTTVSPGGSYTWNFNVTPASPGIYTIGLTMARNGAGSDVAGFGQTEYVSLSASAPFDIAQASAEYVGDDIPTTIMLGHTYYASVTFRNTGSCPWTEDDLARMLVWGSTAELNVTGDCDNRGCGYPEYAIAPGTVVLPGQDYTWNFTMTPNTAGYTCIGLTMAHNEAGGLVSAFGTATFESIIVTPASFDISLGNAWYQYNDLPSTMTVGKTYNVSVTYMNNGWAPWSENDSVRLLAFGDAIPMGLASDCDNYGSGYPEYSIKNGDYVLLWQVHTYSFSVTPTAPGDYMVGFAMVQNSGSTVTPFGGYGYATITVQ